MFIQCKSAWKYIISVKPVNLPVSLELVKEQLYITDGSQDTYITLLIKAAAEMAEKFMNMAIINATYLTYRDCFAACIEIRKGNYNTLNSFEYLKDDSYIAVPADSYRVDVRNPYPKIYESTDEDYPKDGDDVHNLIKIEFIAGFGDSSDDVPNDIKLALMMHVAKLYENRGDCEPDCLKCPLPSYTKMVYSAYRKRMISNELCCN